TSWSSHENSIRSLFADQVFGAALVPEPLVRQRSIWRIAPMRIEITRQSTLVEQGNKMPALSAVGGNGFVEEGGRWVESERSPGCSLGHKAYSVSRRFFESDDATRNVPPRSIELIAPPSEQRVSAIVLDQQVDVDEGRDTTNEEKQLLGQPVCLD